MKSRKKENNVYLIDSFPFNRLFVILKTKHARPSILMIQ